MTRHATAAALLLLLSVATPARAQWVVTDPGVIAEMSTLEHVEQIIASVATDIGAVTRRMARSLSLFVDFHRYLSSPQPLWRTRRVDPAGDTMVRVMDAFNGGDATGLDPVLVPIPGASAVPADAPASLQRWLAVSDFADSALRTGVQATGTIRGGRKVELAIKALQVTHLLQSGSMQKSLDLLSGSTVLGAQQRSARLSLATAVDDQLMVRGLLARDAEADTLAWAASTPPPAAVADVASLTHALSDR